MVKNYTMAERIVRSFFPEIESSERIHEEDGRLHDDHRPNQLAAEQKGVLAAAKSCSTKWS